MAGRGFLKKKPAARRVSSRTTGTPRARRWPRSRPAQRCRDLTAECSSPDSPIAPPPAGCGRDGGGAASGDRAAGSRVTGRHSVWEPSTVCCRLRRDDGGSEPPGNLPVEVQHLIRWLWVLGRAQRRNHGLAVAADFLLNPKQEVLVHAAQECLELPALAAVSAELQRHGEYARAFPALAPPGEVTQIRRDGGGEPPSPGELLSHLAALLHGRPGTHHRPAPPE